MINNVDYFTNYDNSLPYETTFEYFNNKQKDDVCENGICGFSSSKLYSQYSSNECRYPPSRKQQKSKYYEDLTPKCPSLKSNKVKDVKPIQDSLLDFTKYNKQSSVDSKQSSVKSVDSNVSQSIVNKVTLKSNTIPKSSIVSKSSTIPNSEKTQKVKPFVTQSVKTLSKVSSVSKEGKVK
jgi:hypothetical protein